MIDRTHLLAQLRIARRAGDVERIIDLQSGLAQLRVDRTYERNVNHQRLAQRMAERLHADRQLSTYPLGSIDDAHGPRR